jgi:hypothetical protein
LFERSAFSRMITRRVGSDTLPIEDKEAELVSP